MANHAIYKTQIHKPTETQTDTTTGRVTDPQTLQISRKSTKDDFTLPVYPYKNMKTLNRYIRTNKQVPNNPVYPD